MGASKPCTAEGVAWRSASGDRLCERLHLGLACRNGSYPVGSRSGTEPDMRADACDRKRHAGNDGLTGFAKTGDNDVPSRREDCQMNLIFLLIGGFVGYTLGVAVQGRGGPALPPESAASAHLLDNDSFLARMSDPRLVHDSFEGESEWDPEAQEYLQG